VCVCGTKKAESVITSTNKVGIYHRRGKDIKMKSSGLRRAEEDEGWTPLSSSDPYSTYWVEWICMDGVKIARSIEIPIRPGLDRTRESQNRNVVELEEGNVCYDANENRVEMMWWSGVDWWMEKVKTKTKI